MKLYEFDLLIVGAGPVGLFSAFQAGMLNLNCAIIDSLNIIGGQCTMLYPEKPIYDIPAYTRITGAELIEKLHNQIKPFRQNIILNQRVESVEKQGELYLVKTFNSEFKVKAIIFATGGGNFTPNRPPLNDIQKFENKSIFYSVTNTSIFQNKNVMIAGGGDSAVDWAINLFEITNHIYVVHRRDKFRAMENSVKTLHELASAGKITLLVPYQLFELHSNNEQLKFVSVQNLNGEIKNIECDYLLPFFGIASDNSAMLNWGLNLTNNNRYIEVNCSSMETNLKGIFAVGDIASYPGKLKLILTGFSEAALAVHTAFSIINPNQALHFEHSTSKGIPF